MAKSKNVQDLVGDEDDAPAGVGHNSNVAGAQLKSIIERIERLEEEKKDLGADIREIYTEAKGNGYDPKIIRQIIKMRKMSANDRAEQEALLGTYLAALGMLD